MSRRFDAIIIGAGQAGPPLASISSRTGKPPCFGRPPSVWQPCIIPEGMPLPPNTLAELQRDMARLGFVVSQIRQIEEARRKRLEQQHETGPHAMVRLLARIVGVGVETADMLVHEV
jgi:hypothetical protein